MIVDISELSVNYDGIDALQKISFGINEGDFLGIIGPNGAGKSTLFNCMLGIHLQYEGVIKFFNKDIRKSDEYLKHIGYVPQKPVVDKNFPATIREVVSMSQINNRGKVWLRSRRGRTVPPHSRHMPWTAQARTAQQHSLCTCCCPSRQRTGLPHTQCSRTALDQLQSDL